jgi:hypothetical protein
MKQFFKIRRKHVLITMFRNRDYEFEYFDLKFIVEKCRGEGKSLRFFLNKWVSTFCVTANRNAKKVNASARMYTLFTVSSEKH